MPAHANSGLAYSSHLQKGAHYQSVKFAPDVWTPYYKITQRQGPRRLLLEALSHLGDTAMREGVCVDLGTGTGAAARLLYERTRWNVLAVDANPSADQYLCQRFGNECPIGLRFINASFSSVHLPRQGVDLTWAGLSLPYVPRDEIDMVWGRINDSLRPGGLFAGDFFGPEHGHAGRPDMNFLHPREVEALLAGMEVIKLERITRIHPFSQGKPVMMDCYHVIVRKPAAPGD